ncbi:MAG TPA: hypothetical protein VFP40_15070 [Terriglobales bacterium]|nr:hypothetical protein [Terriglobales bacterium]
MAHTTFFADSLHYGRELVHAGIDGLRVGDRLTSQVQEACVARLARKSLWAAALGGSVAFVLCGVIVKREHRLTPVLACGAGAFCADFLWRTRLVRSKMMECAEKEIEKVRDQHWLASHPIDYA